METRKNAILIENFGKMDEAYIFPPDLDWFN